MKFDWADNRWIHDRYFWLWYFSPGVELSRSATLSRDADAVFEHESRTPIETVVIPFVFPDDFSLTFSVSGDYHDLKLNHPSQAHSLHLGHMDCHQMSDAFRWSEYGSIIDWLATEEPHQYPLWAIGLLFSSYVGPTPVCIDECVKTIRDSMLQSTLFSVDESDCVSRYARRIVRDDLEWHYDERIGWHAECEWNYSMRNKLNNEMSFELVRRFFSSLSPSGS